MSFHVKIGRRTLQVPRAVEAAGPAAIEDWMEEQTEPKRRRRPKRKAVRKPRPAPQVTPSVEE
jgi:hypothetical protein